MKKHIATALLPAALSLSSAAFADSGPGCGLGQQIFAGQSGLPAHVMAATTNGSTSNQLFGLTFDSLECNAESVITAEFQRNVYVAANIDNIAHDAANGGGDHLQSLAELMQIAKSDMPAFYQLTQTRFDDLFTPATQNSEALLENLSVAMKTDPELAKYATQ